MKFELKHCNLSIIFATSEFILKLCLLLPSKLMTNHTVQMICFKLINQNKCSKRILNLKLLLLSH